ncbi:hypothetical protein EDD21DRAFT_409917 [Dissophora ornata]|nr:hypothetical protein EDD21DRAFT_409917 [Dissophora ornata]
MTDHALHVMALANRTMWFRNTKYAVGDKVRISGEEYICTQTHTSDDKYYPSKTPMFWESLNKPRPQKPTMAARSGDQEQKERA